MNYSNKRTIRHLLHFLITFVVIGSQIALPLGALVATLQPTPQQVQALAQEAGLAGAPWAWLAARAGDLAAWAQPLWGEPKTAAAQSDAPGGVTTNLSRWWKADAGVTTATGAAQWTDQANGINLTQATTANQPLYNTASNLLNFNPSLTFDGSNDRLNNTSGGVAFGAGGYTAYYVASNTTPSASKYVLGFGVSANLNGFNAGAASTATSKTSGGATFVTQTNAWTAAIANLTRTGFTGGATQPYYLASNGGAEATSSNVSPNVTDLNFAIGARPDGAGNWWQGNIAEVILYSGKQTATDYNKVESYLALKYGLTKAGDYVDTAATTVWDATANSGYANNIAGIGRDDLEALHQKQSQSINSGTQVAIGLGTIAASNAANPNSFAADQSYLVWGDNGQATTFGVSYSPTSFTPVADYFRMSRVWKVQERGTITDVVVFADKGEHLLVSNDPTFATGVTEIALTSGSATVDLSNGQYFTFGNTLYAPGGVTANLAAWYKADGTVGATQWDDASGNDKHMLAAGDGTAARMPTLDATPGSANNFNPRVAFLSNADANRKWTMTASGNNVFATTTTPGTIFNVSNFPDETLYDVPQLYAFEDDDPGLNLVTDRNTANDIRVIFQRDNGGTGSAGWDFVVPGVSQTQSLLIAHAWNYAAGGNTFTFNGYDYTPSTNSFIGATSPRYIFGAELTSGGGEAHSGYTSENIVYAVAWPSNSNERKRINSYLAIKYGITLLGSGTLAGGAADATFGGTADYLDSASTVIWSGTTTNSSYHNNVAGIGRDDASALNQKQSTSTNAGFQPVIALGTIAASNAANSNTFSADKDFMLWGSNNGATTFGVSYSPTSFTPAGGYYRMNRVWKVQETGTVGNVVVQATDADHLLVSSDPTFASGVTEIDMSSGSATVDFTDGEFFTFGKEITAPGAVVNNLVFWSKADDAGCAPGSNCADWDDLSFNGNPIETIGTMTLQAADEDHNFYPFFSGFSTTNYFKDMDSSFATLWPPIDVTEISVFAVTRANSLTADGRITGMDDNDNLAGEPGLSIFDGSPAFYRFSSGPGRVTLNDDVAVNTLAIFGARTSGTQLTLGLDGKYTASAITAGGGFAGDIFNIGYGTWDISGPFPGDIQEVIWYRTDISDTERQRIESYLALKYGITLDQSTAQNYLASDGTTLVWDATANAVYSNNIAGIGRDDATGLNQKQATSTNVGYQPVMGLGTIAAANAANSNTFTANKSYLVWGDNNGTTTFGASYTPTSFTPAAGYNRMNRVWKVQETGTITNVVLQAANAEHLLVSSDPTFASGVTEIDMSSGSATVDFANGQYFTFGRNITGPGGVAAGLWYRADKGTSTTTDGADVTTWTDQAQGIVASQVFNDSNTARPYPKFYAGNSTDYYNYNPSIQFTDINQALGNKTATPFTNGTGSVLEVFLVKPGSNDISPAGYGHVWGLNPDSTITGGSAYQSPGLWAGPYYSSINVGNSGGNNTAYTGENTTLPNFLNLTYSWATGVQGQINGTTITTGYSANIIFNTGDFVFGQKYLLRGSDEQGFTGKIPELIVINRSISATERQQVNSYLALRYGYTFLSAGSPMNYLASDGGAIWNTATNSGYNNNIAGIGRDDASALTQKQSKSVNSGFQVAIGLGAIAASNVANSNTFSTNKSFLVWGDNNQAASYAVTYNPTTFTPAGGYYRMNRVWKVQETGTITNVVVLASSAEHLLVSSDPTFATGVTEIAMSSGSATVDFTDGQYFTFGTAQIAPGGVSADLAFWYKPDAGVTLSSDKVSSWVDQANAIELIPAAANNGPTYYDAGPDLINFNPVLNFTNVTRQDSLRTATGLPAIPNGVSTFSVLLPDDASNRWFLHWGVANFGYYNNYGACNANNPGVWTNSHGGCVNSPTTLGPITTPSFLSVRWNSTAGTNQWQLRRNGQLHSGATSSTVLNVPADTALEIGDVNNRSAGNEYVGNISEVIGYTARLGDTDRQKIESYLSIKYGITYMNDANTAATDYLNSAGTTIWDATANSSYASNIAGIGRDDASALHQKQSQSVNSGFQPTIGLGTIATSNAANSSTFVASKSFLLWGDNNGALTLSAAYNGSANVRLARVWKVQESGTVGAVQVRLPRSILSTAALRTLIVHSSDPNFGTVDRTIPLSSSGGNYVATVDFNNGDFFTFSSISTLPEIDVTPTTIDFGTVNSGSTAPAQAVTIQNQGDVSLNISSIALSGADAARFAISSNNCGASLSAGASCTVQLTFTPTAAGSRSALLVITSNDSDESTVNVALSGATPSSIGGGDTDTYNLAVTKSASVSNATIGTPFTYTITVLNKGTTAASNVVMTDQLPAGVAFGSVNATGGGNCTENSSVVTCTWAALAGGATATVTITVTP